MQDGPLMRIARFLVVDNLPITLVMLLGLTAIYLLLPQPRREQRLRVAGVDLPGSVLAWGAGLGGLALVLTAWLILRVAALTPETFLFYAFSAVAVLAGSLLITQPNPARAALSFALVVLSNCGLFLLLAAPFLMAATIIVYAGAIVVTFLFVIMLAQQEGISDADQRSREPLLAAIAGFALLGAVLYVLQLSYGTRDLDALLGRTDRMIARIESLQAGQPTPAEIEGLIEEGRPILTEYQRQGERLGGQPDGAALRKEATDAQFNDDLPDMKDSLVKLRDLAVRLRNSQGSLQPPANAPLSELSGPAPNRPLFGSDGPTALRRDAEGTPQLPAENTAYLGRSLFSDYLLAVELGGTLLLVATIGAIAIATRRAEGPS